MCRDFRNGCGKLRWSAAGQAVEAQGGGEGGATHLEEEQGRKEEREEITTQHNGGYAEEEGEITTQHNGEYREEKERSKRRAVRM